VSTQLQLTDIPYHIKYGKATARRYYQIFVYSFTVKCVWIMYVLGERDIPVVHTPFIIFTMAQTSAATPGKPNNRRLKRRLPIDLN
jgi:hypothetical protein